MWCWLLGAPVSVNALVRTLERTAESVRAVDEVVCLAALYAKGKRDGDAVNLLPEIRDFLAIVSVDE